MTNTSADLTSVEQNTLSVAKYADVVSSAPGVERLSALGYLELTPNGRYRLTTPVPDPETPEISDSVPKVVQGDSGHAETTVNPGDVWTQLVRADEYLKLEALITAAALARLADENIEVRISQRSLSDAVERPDVDGRRSKFVRTGLKHLIERGWIQHLNPDAPRGNRSHYRLAVPMSQWPF